MIWFFLISMAIITGLVLVGPLLKSGDMPPARGKISLFLILLLISSLGIYSLIGQPNLTKATALQAYQPPAGPSAEDVKAAQEMSPEQRAKMIMGMVDSLAQKLEDSPDNPQGWVRLLRARTVLGQEAQKLKDIETIKAVYADRPNIMNQILATTKSQ